MQRREQAEQIAYFDRVRKCLRVDPATGIANPFPGREGAERIFGLANENAAGKGIGVLRWKMGVKAGLPDIGVFVPRHGFHAAFIELKTSGGIMSDVRKDQRQFQEEANRFGYKSVICFGWYEAWKFTYDYLGWSEY